METHSSVPAWRIPGMGEPGGLPSMGSPRVGHDSGDLAAAAAAMQETQEMWVQSLRWDDTLEKKRAPTPVFLPEKPHGQSLAGYSSKCHRVRDN